VVAFVQETELTRLREKAVCAASCDWFHGNPSCLFELWRDAEPPRCLFTISAYSLSSSSTCWSSASGCGRPGNPRADRRTARRLCWPGETSDWWLASLRWQVLAVYIVHSAAAYKHRHEYNKVFKVIWQQAASQSCHPLWHRMRSPGHAHSLCISTLLWADACPPKKCPYPRGIWTPSNTWLLRPTWVSPLNGILIGSFVFAPCDQHTHRQTDT